MIRAIFFDVGGTLIRPWPSVGGVYARVGRQFGLPAEAEAMDAAFRQAWKETKPSARLTTSEEGWWRVLVERTLAIQGLECPAGYFERLYATFELPEAWQIFPEAVPALVAARQRAAHVGVISNWDSRLRPLLTNLGLTGYLDSITISCEVGAEKPSPHIFGEALRRFAGSVSLLRKQGLVGDHFLGLVAGFPSMGPKARDFRLAGARGEPLAQFGGGEVVRKQELHRLEPGGTRGGEARKKGPIWI